MPPHSLLNSSSAPGDSGETIEPVTQRSTSRIEKELITRPTPDRTRNQNTKRIKAAQKHHHNSTRIDNLTLDRCSHKNAEIRKNAHELIRCSSDKRLYSSASMSRTARSRPTSAARAIMLWPIFSSTIEDISAIARTFL